MLEVWSCQYQNLGRLSQERNDGENDENSDEDGADGIYNQPTKSLHQERGDYHPHTSQCVRQNMEEHSW